jgi:hypothetical protein
MVGLELRKAASDEAGRLASSICRDERSAAQKIQCDDDEIGKLS